MFTIRRQSSRAATFLQTQQMPGFTERKSSSIIDRTATFGYLVLVPVANQLAVFVELHKLLDGDLGWIGIEQHNCICIKSLFVHSP